ncbi:MAG: putative metal-binding motif-containing protein [Myxococcales bacterium]|nr:putative metal-binding motif-containing protein [Myxococcales bacterium]
MPMIRPTPHVLRSLTVTLALAAVMTGCPPKTEGGLLLKVVVEAPVRADCLQVTITDNGRVRFRSTTPRLPMQNEYFVGVARSNFPASLTFQASAFQGRCADETEWKLSSRSVEKTQAFPATGVEQFELTIGQPDATLDGDRDTYVDTGKGGTDCNDLDAMVNPGAMQACSSSVDTNCNGKLFCNDTTCANTAACLQPATGLAFETSLPTLVAFDCSGAVAVQSVANGMPAAVTSDTTLTLVPTGTASPGVELFSDTSCTTALVGSTLPLPFGTSRATFSFRAPTAGALTLTASAPGLGSTTLNTAITDRPVASLSLTPMAVSSRAGACSSAVQVTALDDRGMPTNVGSAGLMLGVGYLPAGTNTVEVFTDAACTPTMMGVPPFVPVISAGTSSTQFFVKGSRATPAGAPIQVELSAPTVNGGMPARLALTVTPGDAQRLEFTASVLGLRNAVCSTAVAEVELRDANGNVTTAGPSGVTVMLAYTPPGAGGTLEFFSAAGCAGTATAAVTIPANASRAGVYLRANAPGTYGVTATGFGLAMPTTQLQVDVATMDPTALVFPNPTARVSVGAGSCSAGVRLQTRETNSTSSPVSPVPANVDVTLSASIASTATFFSDPNCLMALTNSQLRLNAGSSEATFYFSGTIARDFTVSASAATLSTTTPPQNARITPAPTSKLVFQPPTTVSALANDCTGSFGLVAFDTFNNPTYANGPITPSATPSVALPAGVAFSTTSACTTLTMTVPMADGGVTFFAKAQGAQQYTISATGISSSTTTSATFTVDAGAPSVLRVFAQPPAMLGAGSCAAVQVERFDGFMNLSPGPAQGFTVAVNTTNAASVHGDLASCTSGVAGPALGFLARETRATFYVRGRTASTTSFTVASAPAMVTTGNMQVLASAATLLRFAMNTPAPTSAVGACAQATVERLDVEGNLTTLPTNLMVTLTATGPGSMGGLLLASGGACGSTAQTSVGLSLGVATSRNFSYEPRATGLLSFDVTGAGLTTASGSTTVGAGAVARVRFVSPPTMAQQFGSCVPVTLEALDVGNNPVTSATNVNVSASATGSFFTSTDCSTGMTSSVTVPASGQATFRYRPGALGAVTLTATPMTGMADTAMFSVVAGDEAILTRGNFMATTTAGGCVDFTVRRVDSGMNDAVGALRPVTVTLSGPASVASNEAQVFTGTGCMGTALANPGSVDIPAAMSTATFSVRVRKVGSLTLSTTSSPLTPPTDTTTTVVAGALAAITFVTTPPASLTANTCSPVVTVNGTDSEGNPAALGTQTLTMASGLFSSASDCMTPIVNLVAGTATTASFYLRNSAAGPAVALTVGATPSAMQNWVITGSPATKLEVTGLAASIGRFACIGPLTVRTVDATDVPATIPTARVIGLSSTGTTFFFSDSGCTTALPSNEVTVGATMSESPQFYFQVVVPAAGPQVAVTATDTTGTGPLTAGVDTASVTGTSGTLNVSAATSDIEFFDCELVTVERRTNGGLPFTFGTTPVSVSVTAGTGLTLHAVGDTACATGTATSQALSIGLASSSAQFRVRGRSAAPANSTTPATATLTASDTNAWFSNGVANVNVLPLVRRGSCTLASAANSVNCPLGIDIPVDRNRTFLITQAVGSAATASEGNVRCRLVSTSTVTCDRSAASGGDVLVEWQTASWGRDFTAGGVSVQHFDGTTSASTGQVNQAFTFVSGASRATSFLLFSHGTTGSENAGDDFLTGRLEQENNVRLESTGNFATPLSWAIQVVSISSLSSVFGSVGSTGGASYQSNALASQPMARSAILASARVATESGNPEAMCRRRVRAQLSSDTLAAFARARGAGGNCTNTNIQDTRFIRMTFPVALASVQTASLQISGADAFAEGSLTAVALDRTIGFFSGQGPGGQASGETDFATDDIVGHSQARLTFTNDTTVRFTRGATGSSSEFTAYIISFLP